MNHTVYPTKFQVLDSLVKIKEGNLVLVCGQSKVGKSIFLQDLSLNFSTSNLKVMYISLQKNADELMSYLLTNLSSVNQHTTYELITAREDSLSNEVNVDHEEIERLFLGMNELKALPIIISRKFEISEIESLVIKAKESNNVDVVIIDSLNLIYNPEYNSLYEQNKNITQRLKKLAAENEVPIILAGNVNSDIKTRNCKRPIYVDIPFSIEYDFDIILGMYRDELVNPEFSKQQGITEIEVMKNNGQLGAIKLAFIQPLLKHVNLTYEYWDSY